LALHLWADYPVDVLACLERRLGVVCQDADVAPPGLRIDLRGLAESRFRTGFGIVASGDAIVRHDFKLHRCGGGWAADTQPSAESAEAVLRWVAGRELLDRGGRLLHAASVVVDGWAHLFLGASGAGKTTVSRHAQADQVLCDELSLIAPSADGTWTAWPSPFWGDGSYGSVSQAAPLAALWVLRGRDKTGWQALAQSEAALEICQRTIDLSADEQFPALLLAQTQHLLDRVPALALSYRLGDALRPQLAMIGARPCRS
jgi:hypothetical protein